MAEQEKKSSGKPQSPADTIEAKDEGQRSAEKAKVASADVAEKKGANPQGDTVEPPEAFMAAVTEAEVKKAAVPDQNVVATGLARERQHPSLTRADNGEAIEIAERTIDHDTVPTTQHVKDFVTTRREYDSEDHDAIHERNMRAVRQYMVNQGMRPDAKVVFLGESEGPEIRFRPDRRSVTLRYGVEAVPSVVAVGMEQVHTVIDQNGPTATQLAEYQAQREDRIRASRRALI